jgi:capsular exopolysaccharide synthesis family protein
MIETFNFSVLQRRKGRILLSGLVMAAVALGISKVVPKNYSSNGGMIVENSEPNVPELGMGVATGGGNNDGVVLTQLEVLRSRGLIERVVNDLNLTGSPSLMPISRLPFPVLIALDTVKAYLTNLREYIAPPDASDTNRDDTPTNVTIDYVQKHLKVEATEHSSVIGIQFEAGSPKTASSVVNAVMGAYLSNDVGRRQQQIEQVNKWLVEQTQHLEQDALAAQRRVEQYVAAHPMPEIQGSSASAIQLSRDKDLLNLARQELTHQQAILDSMRGGGAQAQQTLDSRTIQIYRERESQIIQQIASLSTLDPRRISLESALNGIHAAINTETDKIGGAVKRNVDIARANVQAMEAAVATESAQAQTASIGSAVLYNLKADAEAKRQMYISFGTRSEQTKLATAQLPSARILFPAAPMPTHSFALLSLIFGFVGGMFSAIAWIVLRESLSTSINSTAKMALITGLPVFGSLPEVTKSARRNVLMLNAPAKTATLFDETLRAIWLTLRSDVQSLKGGTSVIVTSSEVGEGKTTVATTLARRIAADGYKVLLIDADLRRPRLASVFKMHAQFSLEAVLKGAATLDKAVMHDATFGVDCLLAEGNTVNPMRVLSSDEFKALLIEAKRSYDFVVLDSPPVLRVTDAVIMASLCQHVLFIVGAGRVPGDAVGKAVNRFALEDRSKIITLLTRVRPGDMDKSDYFGGYENASYEDF